MPEWAPSWQFSLSCFLQLSFVRWDLPDRNQNWTHYILQGSSDVLSEHLEPIHSIPWFLNVSVWASLEIHCWIKIAISWSIHQSLSVFKQVDRVINQLMTWGLLPPGQEGFIIELTTLHVALSGSTSINPLIEWWKYHSYGHLLVITGYKWDYTFYKWGYKYL